MSEAAAVLESSAPVMDIERGPLVNLTGEQRQEYRKTGELPKIEVAATSLETPGESGTPKVQEKPKNEPKKQTAEERIADLEKSIAYIKKGAGLETKPKADSTPAKSEPASARPKEDDFATHAEFEEALIDWRVEQREAKKAETAMEEARIEALNAKVERARERHGDIDTVIQPIANEIYQDSAISPVIKQMIGDSDIIVDLIYTIGNDKAEFAKFTKMAKENPGKAIRYIALTESLIAQELSEKEAAAELVAEPPAKLKTQAPRPPAEAGGRAATPPDSLQAALDGSGGKLNAGLKAEFLRRDLARLKG